RDADRPARRRDAAVTGPPPCPLHGEEDRLPSRPVGLRDGDHHDRFPDDRAAAPRERPPSPSCHGDGRVVRGGPRSLHRGRPTVGRPSPRTWVQRARGSCVPQAGRPFRSARDVRDAEYCPAPAPGLPARFTRRGPWDRSHGETGRAGRAHARSPSPSTSAASPVRARSEEHTSELQSRENLVCRLLLEKNKIKDKLHTISKQLKIYSP